MKLGVLDLGSVKARPTGSWQLEKLSASLLLVAIHNSEHDGWKVLKISVNGWMRYDISHPFPSLRLILGYLRRRDVHVFHTIASNRIV